MKAKILTLLKTKFEGVSEAILNRIAEKLAKTVTTDEQAQTAVDGVTLQSLLDSYGDSRATEASNTAVTNYEKKYNIKEGKPVAEPNPDPKPTDEPKTEPKEDIPAWAQALVASNKALTEKLTAMEIEKTAKGRKAQLQEILTKLPDEVKSIYENSFDMMSFENDEAFNTWLEGTKTTVEGLSAKITTLTPPKGGGGSNTDQTGTKNQELAERIKEQQAQTEHETSVISGFETTTTK